MRRILVIFLISLSIAACGRRAPKQQAVTQDSKTQTAEAAPVYVMPEPPSYLSSREEQAEWVAAHYWDRFDFDDPAWLSYPDATHNVFHSYMRVLFEMLPSGKAGEYLIIPLQKAQDYPAMYDRLLELYDYYLYHPNSPYKNEDLYVPVLESVLANPKYDELMKLSLREKLSMIMKNRVGDKAPDFNYITVEGEKGTLYGMNADYTLLFFHDLGCSYCMALVEDVAGHIASNITVQNLYQSGKLKVIAIEPDAAGKEMEEYGKFLPQGWLDAYEPAGEISGKKLYDMRSFPSMYLLDKDKKVLIKDFDNPALIIERITQ